MSAKKKQSKLILYSEFRKIQNELNRQLKPHRLKVKFKTNFREWGDQIAIEVTPITQKPYTTLGPDSSFIVGNPIKPRVNRYRGHGPDCSVTGKH